MVMPDIIAIALFFNHLIPGLFVVFVGLIYLFWYSHIFFTRYSSRPLMRNGKMVKVTVLPDL